MYDKKVFRLDYPTGNTEINVGAFFGTSDKKKVDKLLRLMRKYCSDEQRKELLFDLRYEYAYRREMLDTLGHLRYKRQELLSTIVSDGVSSELPSPEKSILKQRDKLNQIIKQLSKERWAE